MIKKRFCRPCQVRSDQSRAFWTRIVTPLSGRRHSGDRCTRRIPCSRGSGVFDGGESIRDKRPGHRVFSQNACRPHGRRPFALKSSWSFWVFGVLSNLRLILGPLSFPVFSKSTPVCQTIQSPGNWRKRRAPSQVEDAKDRS